MFSLQTSPVVGVWGCLPGCWAVEVTLCSLHIWSVDVEHYGFCAGSTSPTAFLCELHTPAAARFLSSLMMPCFLSADTTTAERVSQKLLAHGESNRSPLL